MQAKEMRGREPARGQPAAPAAAGTRTAAEISAEEQPNITADVEYLLARGWAKVASGESPNPLKRWLDPQSGKPDTVQQRVPEVRDLAGRVTRDAVRQTVVSTPLWYYSLQEALTIQRDREAKGKR